MMFDISGNGLFAEAFDFDVTTDFDGLEEGALYLKVSPTNFVLLWVTDYDSAGRPGCSSVIK